MRAVGFQNFSRKMAFAIGSMAVARVKRLSRSCSLGMVTEVEESTNTWSTHKVPRSISRYHVKVPRSISRYHVIVCQSRCRLIVVGAIGCWRTRGRLLVCC